MECLLKLKLKDLDALPSDKKCIQKKVRKNKLWRILMIVSWQIPKFNCSDAAIKGDEI
jgi:hypothetical protein